MAEPRFKLESVSRKWAKDWLVVNTQIQRNTMLLQSEISEDATPAQRQVLKQAQMEAMEGIDGLIARQEEMLAEVLVDVPREWLVENAPAKLNWSDRASLNWLVDDHYNDLLMALAAARDKRRTDSKN